MQLLTTNSGQILIAIMVAINIFSIIVMFYDKHKAVHDNNSSRTPEGLIFFLAAALGSIGVYVGMMGFRHKTRKWYFQIGIPLLIIQNIAFVWVVWKLFGEN